MIYSSLKRDEFLRQPAQTEIASKQGPVLIADRGRPSHVLLTFDDYRKLALGRFTQADILALPPGAADIELELPERGERPRSADLS
ncbi:hypothetical protein [Massilia sp. BJB1822]|uniref:hypothetical protein n=1 Tax=Massilia sp. BJB1822 TaxID=2744470 RepID=UPI001593FCBE|nr:hypothetical protein [Massilia sp. BJB1822]NVE00476.1 hypothetical protein [Massilia sp. BJB1822]